MFRKFSKTFFEENVVEEVRKRQYYKKPSLQKKEHEKERLKKRFSKKRHLNLIFIGKTKMKSISSTYKNEDVALPVLSFPIRDNSNPEKEFIGEVFICYPQAILLAAERNKRVDDLMTELVEHGVRNLLK